MAVSGIFAATVCRFAHSASRAERWLSGVRAASFIRDMSDTLPKKRYTRDPMRPPFEASRADGHHFLGFKQRPQPRKIRGDVDNFDAIVVPPARSARRAAAFLRWR